MLLEKEQAADQLLGELYDKIDDGGLDIHEQAMYDVLTWLLEDGDKPELE